MSAPTGFKGTPPPWGVNPEIPSDIYGSTTSPEEMELLASVYPMKRDGIHDSWKANAKLISCAPELGQELLDLLPWMISHMSEDYCERIEALLKKAGLKP